MKKIKLDKKTQEEQWKSFIIGIAVKMIRNPNIVYEVEGNNNMPFLDKQKKLRFTRKETILRLAENEEIDYVVKKVKR